jgi:hypothetical protein
MKYFSIWSLLNEIPSASLCGAACCFCIICAECDDGDVFMVGRNPLMSLSLPLSMCKDHAAIFWFINQEKVMKHSWTLGFPHQTTPLSRPTFHHPPAGGQVFRSVVLSMLRWMTVAKRCLKQPAVMCGLNYKPTIIIKLCLLQITHVHTHLHTGTVANFTFWHRSFTFKFLAHSVCKMWIIQEPKKVALWNKRHFEEKNRECAACLKYSVLILVEKNIKCNIWRVAVRPSSI